jgi:hypothetical protein
MFSPRHQPATRLPRRIPGVLQFALSVLGRRMHSVYGAERRDRTRDCTDRPSETSYLAQPSAFDPRRLRAQRPADWRVCPVYFNSAWL